MTVDYLKTRKQFGVPIGAFQALQHRASDMVVALEQARSMMMLATMMAGEDDAAERGKAISAAKVQIGRSAKLHRPAGDQLHGGIGMTDGIQARPSLQAAEHDRHRVRRRRLASGEAQPRRGADRVVRGADDRAFERREQRRHTHPDRGVAILVGPLPPIDRSAARSVDGKSLVEAEAAKGGGRRPAFTRLWPSTTIGSRDRGRPDTQPLALFVVEHARWAQTPPPTRNSEEPANLPRFLQTKRIKEPRGRAISLAQALGAR